MENEELVTLKLFTVIYIYEGIVTTGFDKSTLIWKVVFSCGILMGGRTW